MSKGDIKFKYAEALGVAEQWVALLGPHCKQIEVAGSLRRKKPEVGDIEICLEPIAREIPSLFGPPGVEYLVYSVIARAIFEQRLSSDKSGPRYNSLNLASGLKLELFIVRPPATWGVIFAIRTGGERFSKKLVTTKRRYGFLPSYFQVREGQLWAHDNRIDTPTERAFFDAIGLQWIEPEARDEFALRR